MWHAQRGMFPVHELYNAASTNAATKPTTQLSSAKKVSVTAAAAAAAAAGEDPMQRTQTGRRRMADWLQHMLDTSAECCCSLTNVASTGSSNKKSRFFTLFNDLRLEQLRTFSLFRFANQRNFPRR